MSETTTPPQLDLGTFSLSETGNVHVKMPAKPEATPDDIEAQLFAYVATAEKGSGILSIADLTDEWVQGNFEGLSNMEELRAAIKRDMERETNDAYNEIRVQRSQDALVDRVQGTIPEDVLNAHVEASRSQYAERLALMGMSKAQYLRQTNITDEEFEQNLRDDVAYQLKLNAGLDLMAEANGVTVDIDHITEYLTSEDPDAFVAEVKERGQEAAACQAAARVKVMRDLIDNAVVEPE